MNLDTLPTRSPSHPQEYGATSDVAVAVDAGADYQLQEGSFEDEYNESNDDDYDREDDDGPMSMAELLYSSSSYHAIVKPVSVTMILAALSVCYINNDQTLEEGEAQMAEAYQVFKTDGSAGNGNKLALSFVNSLVMVTVICAMTFIIVFLYKFRCMAILIGYMMLSSAMLLGVLGGVLWETAIEVYRWPVDVISFFFALYNFAVVGVIAVFWAQGIPTYVSQGYLIATSVILAWQLAHFDAWTTWTLLIMLALYDLCAVLTPIGPLRALVNLMSRDDAPAMPGLLYEAELPPEAQRPGVPTQQEQEEARRSAMPGETPSDGTEGQEATQEQLRVDIPLALAQVYNLPIVGVNSNVSSPLLVGEIPENPTPAQLRTLVTVQLPENGGRIKKARGKYWQEFDRNGNPKRMLWMDRNGKVFAEACDEDDDDDDDGSNSIRLGLGDFIFYSVLVAKAAQYSFTAFAACMLVITGGLGGTLILLAVYHHALPALPISIFLGVAAYLVTRALIQPWVEAIMTEPLYV